MSRAFVSEDRGLEDVPVAPRAVLPPGAPNWVTPRGHRLLQQEREILVTTLRDTDDKAQQAALLQRQAELQYRLASAQIIDLSSSPPQAVRFGATVRLRSEGAEWQVKLVGADEADPSLGLISIHSPLARALLGRMPHQTAILQNDEGEEITTEILEVRYNPVDPDEE